MRPYQVLVAGGGPAGAVAAHVLVRAGRSVLLVDEEEPARRKIGESLPAAALPLLRELGLERLLANGAHLPCYGNAYAWGSDELASTDFIADPHGLGWHLDRRRFDSDLRSSAQREGAALRRTRLTAVRHGGGLWDVDFSDGGSARARWLIDATGRHAAVGRRVGAKRRLDDALVALCSWSRERAGDTDARTVIEAVREGWWYTARVPAGRVTVLHVDAERAGRLRKVGQWRRALGCTRHVRRFAVDTDLEEDVTVCEAAGARMDRFGGEGWVAVGDAALAFDPLSAQGILTALYTGMLAGRAIDDELELRDGAREAYCSRLETIRAAYLHHRAQAYVRERRWPLSPFWARRCRLVG